MTATRGPWTFDLNHGFPQVLGPDGKEVARTGWAWQDDVQTRCEDNARLIALAPELLEALKECWEKVELDRDTMLKVKALIAKAEGGK